MLQETEESEARSYTVAIFSDLFCQSLYLKNFLRKNTSEEAGYWKRSPSFMSSRIFAHLSYKSLFPLALSDIF